MGDWEWGYKNGLWGEDGILYGLDSPCWNDDWERELLKAGYQTVEEWNSIGKIVKKGERGRYLPCAGIRVFCHLQTAPSKFSHTKNSISSEEDEDKYFATFEEAISWTKENLGKVITRAPNGKDGYIIKK